MFLAPTFALNYGLGFAALMASIVHVSLSHGKEVWNRWKNGKNDAPDIHMKLMLKYRECPQWWYGALFVISMALGLSAVLGYPSQLPCEYSLTRVVFRTSQEDIARNTNTGWGFFVSIIIALIFIGCTSELSEKRRLDRIQIPTCMILAITNITLCIDPLQFTK